MKRTASNHNLSFAVLVAAYVFVCAAVPSANAASALAPSSSRDGRPTAIRISGAFSPAGVVFARQNPSRSGGGYLAALPGGGRHVWLSHDYALVFAYQTPVASRLYSRITTGALTQRFLAAS